MKGYITQHKIYSEDIRVLQEKHEDISRKVSGRQKKRRANRHSCPSSDVKAKQQRKKNDLQIQIEPLYSNREHLNPLDSILTSDNPQTPIDLLCNINPERRITAAYDLISQYANLPHQQQLAARINLILMAWRDIHPKARIAAIEALMAIKHPDSFSAMIIALSDDEADVRAAAARALGVIPRGEYEALPISDLVTAAHDSHWNVRAWALQTMGILKERAFLNTIFSSLDDKDASVRIEALYALVALEGKGAQPRLNMIMQRDREPLVRHMAEIILATLQDTLDGQS